MNQISERLMVLRAMPEHDFTTAVSLGAFLGRPYRRISWLLAQLAEDGRVTAEVRPHRGGSRYRLTDQGRAERSPRAPEAPPSRIRRRTVLMMQHGTQGGNGESYSAGLRVVRVSLPCAPWESEGECWRSLGSVARDVVRGTGRA